MFVLYDGLHLWMTYVSLNDASILKWPKLVELWLEGEWWSSHYCQMEAQLQNKNTVVSCSSSLDLQRKLLAGNVKSLQGPFQICTRIQVSTLVGICLLMQWIYVFCALLGRTTFYIQIVECWNKEQEAAFLAFHVTWGTHPRGIVAFSLIWLNTQLVLEHRQSWLLNSFINLLNVFVSVCVWYGFVR